MKRHYVVRTQSGYYKAVNKNDALSELEKNAYAVDIIHTQATGDNYYHSRVNVVACKKTNGGLS